MKFDHVLVIGFGGPTKPEEIRPFIENVTRGIPIPEERLKEVEHHYHEVGGYSKYTEYANHIINILNEQIAIEGLPLQTFLGMRNWRPYLKEAMAEIKRRGLKRGIGLILAPHRCDSSYEKYIRNVEDAKKEAGAEDVQYLYLGPWYEHPGFIEAQADKIKEELEKIPAVKRAQTPLVFCAHSIPVEMADKSKYSEEVRRSSELVADKLGMKKWQVAWQSRSGSPRQPWLEPDVVSVLQKLREQGEESVVVVPVGFICENVEVLYDLDIEAKQAAEKSGLKFFRAATVQDHDAFIAMIMELIAEAYRVSKRETENV